MLYLMAHRRRGLARRFIALLTAAVMPLCCCVLDAGASCCAPIDQAPVVEVASCCSSQQCQEEQADNNTSEEAPCSDADCSCCLKAPTTSGNWTPPVDTIGAPLPPFALDDLVSTTEGGAWNTNAWDDPPPKPGGMDSLRGHVILQV